MTRETLDKKIQNLLNEILMLESMVENAISDSVAAIINRDIELAKSVYQGDRQINAKRFQLETDCMTTLATTQPIMARDLRMVASILEVTAELERIGDYAKGNAKICILLGSEFPIKSISLLPRMADKTISMLHRATFAFVSKDVESARQIPNEDDEVDALYNQIFRELATLMFHEPSLIDRANYLIWVAHNLERMADRVTNICERTNYVQTGTMIEIDESDGINIK